MSTTTADSPLPRGLLVGAGVLVATALTLVITARVTGYQPDRPAPSPVVASSECAALSVSPGPSPFCRASNKSIPV